MVNNVTCPSLPQVLDARFNLTYNMRTTTAEYPFEVRGFFVGSELDECIFNESVTPYCMSVEKSWETQCPTGAASFWYGNVPATNVTYTVGCIGSSTADEGLCVEQDSVQSCRVTCLYCNGPQDLVFNVTLSEPYDIARCGLSLAYNSSLVQGSTNWANLFSKGSDVCAGLDPYCDISEQSGLPLINFNVSDLGTYHMENMIGQTVYKWTVECTAPLGLAEATPEWMFRYGC
ncbi:MAG: hypothetical protein V1875_00020 [Candidatus Altiarchaeota archaeon]